MVPFRVPITIQHLFFRVPQKGTLILTTTHMTQALLRSYAHWVRKQVNALLEPVPPPVDLCGIPKNGLGFRVCAILSVSFV